MREDLGHADYLGALQRFRLDDPHDPRVLALSGFLIDYPFADRVYPGAFDALAHLSLLGPTVILSDGDAVYQPRKLQRSDLWDAVEGRVILAAMKANLMFGLEGVRDVGRPPGADEQ